jgi:hypothetical protein
MSLSKKVAPLFTVDITHAIVFLVWAQLFFYTVLPGGSVYGFNIKILFLGMYLVLLILYLLRKKIPPAFYLKVFCLLLFVVYYIMIGALPFTNSANAHIEGQLFFITFFFPIGIKLLIDEAILDPRKVVKFIVFAHSFFILIKTFYFGMVFVGNMTPNDIVLIIHNVFNVKVMTLEIVPNVTRIQFNLDLLTIIVFPIVLLSRQLKLNFTSIQLLLIHTLLFSNVLISFSRFIIAGYILIIVIHFFLSIRNFKSLISLGIILGIVVYFSYDLVHEIIELRYSNKISASSDDTRFLQNTALTREFFKNPILGNGMGGFTKDVIRSPDLIFSYELQMLSFLMKFGVIGFSLFVIFLFSFIYPVLKIGDWTTKIILISTYGIWIGANLFNPYLISSFAAVIFTAFICLSNLPSSEQSQLNIIK